MSAMRLDPSVIDQIAGLYLADDRPWAVGFSGGKDSTALLQLVFQALAKIPSEARRKHVHVVSNDTLVEIPQVAQMVVETLVKIEKAADRRGLPIVVAQTRPELDDSFFVNILGRGYPSPTSRFRWCTERMKIDPTTRYIKKLVETRGEVIILLGARKAESNTRAQTMESHRIEGSVLRRHSTLPRSYVYTPIEDWTTQEVWAYLVGVPSPWGGDNRALFHLYKRADGGECPLVIDKSTPSCGNSRFGCWTCTVIENDKAVEGFIESGDEHLEPLLEFRNFLKDARSRRDLRERVRKNGQLKNQDGEEVWGPFTLEARKTILRRLLETEKKAGFQLISVDELLLIQRLWKQGGRSLTGPTADIDFSVAKILRETRGETAMSGYLDLLEGGVDPLLKAVCEQHDLPPELIERLKAQEQAVAHLQRREGIFQRIDEILDSVPAK